MTPAPPASSGSSGPAGLAARVREAALLEGDFVLSSGKRSRFYVDKYLFSAEPGLLADLAGALAARLPAGTEKLAGVELGAVPLVVAVSLHTGLPYVIVRKAAKGHGGSAGSRIEGRLGRGEKVAVVEDVVTTGAQAVEAAGELVGAGARVEKIVAVLDRREASGEEAGGTIGGFGFSALLTPGDLGVRNGD